VNTLGFDAVLEIRKTGICPVCKEHGVDPRGIGGHVRGARHKAYANMAELRARGLVRVSGSAADHWTLPILRAADVPLVEGVESVTLHAGSLAVYGRSRKPAVTVHRGTFCDAAIAALVRQVVAFHVPDTLKLMLEALMRLPEARRVQWLRSAAAAIALDADPLPVFDALLGERGEKLAARRKQYHEEKNT